MIADPIIEQAIQRSKSDYDYFNSVILGRGPYWSRQREICRSLMKYRVTAAPAGNGVGKSFLAAGVLLAFAVLNPDCKVIAAAPTQAQLSGVLWSEVESAYKSAAKNGMPLGGRMKSLTYELGENWRVEGFGQGSVEARSGRHAGKLLALIDESSGVAGNVLEAIDSLNPSHYLYLGNPLRPEGKFFDICENQADNPHVNVIRIPSLESPHIHLERSPYGMADATWLESMRFEYGEDSIWWLSHILAQFPGSADDTLFPRDWLDLAERIIHVRSGPTRIAVDLAKGNGGDQSVILVRDDNGILWIEHSNRWDLGETARRVAVLAERYNVTHSRISFDAANLGTDFGNRLAGVGIKGAMEYLGISRQAGEKFANLRAAAAWCARRRLDPKREIPINLPVMSTRPRNQSLADQFAAAREAKRAAQRGPVEPVHIYQPPFAIATEWMKLLRPELQGMRYEQEGDSIVLELKEAFAARLKHSPDFADTFCQSFAFPNS